ncbi:RDD family protein [Larsenimonas rhizosphaerae]|uniref:RDD family protein n=1 Tax=Larsenimonas rhizosphaerae TaxID=2944682 RepID=A0AA41ZJM9_9GAMM|nr:RDD family protein [Larsenimonas rhizosphaerae]MCX2525198.1 RDD family protein [Larsenimonas rhizosphaerae]
MTYAGFWRRAVAFFIDFSLLMGGTTLVSVFTLFTFIFFLSPDYSVALEQVTYTMANKPYISPLIHATVFWLYFAGYESSKRQATIGKLVMGLKVCTLDGHRIGFGRASARHFSKYLSGLLLMVGYLMGAFTKKKQALHDKMTRCVVINVKAIRIHEEPVQAEPVDGLPA